jgi:hypothetical protein
MDKYFINLTNGIEAIREYNLEISDISFIRIQSSHFEAHKFDDVLLELDHNLLMHLALGYNCIIYDYGARSETAKALRIGLEWIKFVLSRRWLGVEYIPVIKYKIVTNYFEEQYKIISNRSRRKIDYYKKYMNCSEINITGIQRSTIMDNKPEYYRDIIIGKVNSEIE